MFGESAGGNLAAALVQEAQRRGGPRIALQVLGYPAVDRFDDSPSMYENMAGPLLSRSWLEWFWGLYLNTPDEGTDLRVGKSALLDVLADVAVTAGAIRSRSTAATCRRSQGPSKRTPSAAGRCCPSTPTSCSPIDDLCAVSTGSFRGGSLVRRVGLFTGG